MSSIFGKPKTPSLTMPTVSPPMAPPETGPETEDYALREARRRAGFRKTILTGALEPSSAGKKKLLGG